MIQLAVFDIDGTLIPFETHEIAPETEAAIRELKRRGIRVAIASGRQFVAIQPEIKQIGFDYYICSNGAYITDATGQVLAQHTLPRQITDALVQDMIELDYPIVLRYVHGQKDGNPNQSIFPYSRKYFSDKQFAVLKAAMEAQKALDLSQELPIACLAHIDAERKPWFEARYPDLLFMLTCGGDLCDINHRGVHKGTGMRDICTYLGIDPAHTIAFGDDGNDVDLVRMAGIGVAMGNALPEMVAAADEQTAACADLGVVQALRRHNLLE